MVLLEPLGPRSIRDAGRYVTKIAVRKVIDLIGRQPARRRAVALLFFLDDFSYAEIAETLAITESILRTHVERMRVLMKPLVDFGTNGRGGVR